MADNKISASALSDLSCRIADLDDEPDMDADELKRYFDSSPQELFEAHNAMVNALTQSSAASDLGFSATGGVPATSIQEAIESVQSQIAGVSAGSVPLASISRGQLDDDLTEELDGYAAQTRMIASQASQISELEDRADTLEAFSFGTQFPLMVLALAQGLPEAMKDEVATASLGCGYENQVHALGEQLSLLCAWKGAALPSAAFREKQTFSDLLTDVATLQEIESHTTIYNLIHQSATADAQYTQALVGVK